jgi:hypothetical protein
MHSNQRAYYPKYCYLPNQNCPFFGARADLGCSRRLSEGEYLFMICISETFIVVYVQLAAMI